MITLNIYAQDLFPFMVMLEFIRAASNNVWNVMGCV